MRQSRRHADDVRAGRRPAGQARGDVADHSAAAAYELLLPQLAGLRASLATAGIDARPLHELRRDHAELERVLRVAIAQAFAADAVDAPTPPNVSSWVAEGLARSQERELALFAAADAAGVLQANTPSGSAETGGTHRARG